MLILAIDACLDSCALAFVAGGVTLAARAEPMSRGHAERIAPLAQALATEAGLDFSALDRIAVTTGPGSFTGVRVGLAFARGLAVALEIPAIGLSTIEALALGEGEAGLRAAAIPGVGGGYVGAWRDGAEWTPPHRIEGEAAFVAAIAALRAQGAHFPIATVPDAVALARLAAQRDPARHPPAPTYLRPPDAKPAKKR